MNSMAGKGGVARSLLLLHFCLLLVLIGFTSGAAATEEPRRILALIDYIGGDYRNAVQGGKIISADEYREMSEFSARSLELFGKLKAAEEDKAGIEKPLKALAAHIKNMTGDDEVPRLAQEIKERLIKTYKIAAHPRTLPNYQIAQQIYAENCAQCHGESGKGDGPGRESMSPKTPPPANFTDGNFMAGLSPFKIYNTTSFGVDNTAMASFAALSDEQRWQVSFYVMALRFSSETAAAGQAWLKGRTLPGELSSIGTLATSSDDDLSEKIKKNLRDAPVDEILAYLRRGLLESQSSDPLTTARALIADAVALYGQGEKEKAYQKAIEAYLDGFEMAEPALFAKDAAFGRSLEAQFTRFRNAIRQGVSLEELGILQREIEVGIDQARQILAQTGRFSRYYAFLGSALIIVREGLEAALILAAIIAMLKVMGAAHTIRYLHCGWILALIAGVATWLTAQTVLTLSGQQRESMEGFISIFAAAALFYVGYWLHTRTEAKRWQAYLQDRMQNALSRKSVFALVGISFFAVYREAFEVVLFYQALWLQNEHGVSAILAGFGAGVIVLVAATFAIFKLGLRLPLRYFFGATGTLLYAMAFIFAGTGVYQLQAAGWLPATPLDFPPPVPLLGIYPTLETVAAQGVVLSVFVTTSLWLARDGRKAA